MTPDLAVIVEPLPPPKDLLRAVVIDRLAEIGRPRKTRSAPN